MKNKQGERGGGVWEGESKCQKEPAGFSSFLQIRKKKKISEDLLIVFLF